VLVVSSALRRIFMTLRGVPVPAEAFGPPEIADVKIRCC
jgi:hypothetical protein